MISNKPNPHTIADVKGSNVYFSFPLFTVSVALLTLNSKVGVKGRLLFFFKKKLADLKNKTTMYSVKLPFQGQPSKLSAYAYYVMGDFLRSDHVSFWESIPSLSAIFLSDTADLRGHMTSCYHEDCDRLSRVTPRMLQFLQKTIDVILAVTNDVTKMSCPQRILKFTHSADVSGRRLPEPDRFVTQSLLVK